MLSHLLACQSNYRYPTTAVQSSNLGYFGQTGGSGGTREEFPPNSTVIPCSAVGPAATLMNTDQTTRTKRRRMDEVEMLSLKRKSHSTMVADGVASSCDALSSCPTEESTKLPPNPCKRRGGSTTKHMQRCIFKQAGHIDNGNMDQVQDELHAHVARGSSMRQDSTPYTAAVRQDRPQGCSTLVDTQNRTLNHRRGHGGACVDDERTAAYSASASASGSSTARSGPVAVCCDNKRGMDAGSEWAPILLYTPNDVAALSPYQCLARQQIELFAATEQECRASVQGRIRPIVVGQVGIRCRHCICAPMKQRKSGSVYYPSKLDRLYQTGQKLTVGHLSKYCDRIPDEIRKTLLFLKVGKSSFGGGKEYWAKCLRQLNVYETNCNGLAMSDVTSHGSVTDARSVATRTGTFIG